MSPVWAPAPATPSSAVIASSSLSVVGWSSPQRCLVLKPLNAGQTWCWSSSLGRGFSWPQGRRGCPPPVGPCGQCPPCPLTPSMSSQERRVMVAGWHRKNRHVADLSTHTGIFLPEQGGQSRVTASVRLLGKGPHPCQVWRKTRKMLKRAAATKYS